MWAATCFRFTSSYSKSHCPHPRLATLILTCVLRIPKTVSLHFFLKRSRLNFISFSRRKKNEIKEKKITKIFTYFVSKNWFQASAEIGEIVSLFVNLYSFSVVLYFSIHAVGALFKRMLYRFASLSLKCKNYSFMEIVFVAHYVAM